MNPRFPVYIPSKGRWESCLTMKALDRICVPFHVVVEAEEHDAYAAVVGAERLLVLPFSGKGLVPARNWIWEHAIASGAEWHWTMDDNLQTFLRFNRNRKLPVADGTIFRCAEDFALRFSNVAEAGFNYEMFCNHKQKHPPFYLNTRIYSCNLIRNDTGYRWRGVYNDDTDLALRMLKDGWCTILFNTFLCKKITTMTLPGGNTPIYQDDGRLRMAESLVEQHPDVARVSWKWNRYQHHVDYSGFRHNKLVLKPGLVIPDRVNNYGMRLQQLRDGKWEDMEATP